MKWFGSHNHEPQVVRLIKQFPNCPFPLEIVGLLRAIAAAFEDARKHLSMIARDEDFVFGTVGSARFFMYRCVNPLKDMQDLPPEVSHALSLLKEVEEEIIVKWLVEGGAQQLLDSVRR